MHKRYLDCTASELLRISKLDLFDSLRGCEGRLLISETIGNVQPLLSDITNAEFAASVGADLILLNVFDVDNPQIKALPSHIKPHETIRELIRLTGRVIGINLEAIDKNFKKIEGNFWNVENSGRLATAENAIKAFNLGIKFIIIGGNPYNGSSNLAIKQCLQEINKAIGDKMILIAGKMHASGILSECGDSIISKQDIEDFIKCGADIILLPGPGTIPGITVERATELINHTHKHNAMTITSIGTSQEGSDVNTIRQIALMCKMCGTDLHHIGDSGYLGMALPENIFAYSVAIRGIRHTYSRMARSINR